MKLKLLLTTMVALVFGLHSAGAQVGERVQRHRIRQGVRSGELTRAETRNLASRERNMHRDIRRAKADGVITRRERREIRRERRHNSRTIYRKRHNRRNRI
jgi:hypothetical protein